MSTEVSEGSTAFNFSVEATASRYSSKPSLTVKLNYSVTFHFLTFEMAISFERFIFLSWGLYMYSRKITIHTLVILTSVVMQSLVVC